MEHLVRPATIDKWTKRVDEERESALVQTPEPIHRFPDFVLTGQPVTGERRIREVVGGRRGWSRDEGSGLADIHCPCPNLLP